SSARSLCAGEPAGPRSQAVPSHGTGVRQLMTIYANLVKVRSAGKDVVLEFGSFFPDGDQQFPPRGFPPELRVVLSADLLEPLVEILRERMAPVSPSVGDRAN